MKKIILAMLVVVLSASSVMAFGVSGNVSGSNDTDKLMGDFDSLVEEVKNEHVCAMDVKKCDDGSFVGRVGEKCEFTKCPQKKEKKKKEKRYFNTGITGGVKGVNNKVPAPKEILAEWVKVDEDFSFNTKTQEWKDDQGVCHTCTEENGFMKNGKIVIDGKMIAGVPTSRKGENKIDLEANSKFGNNFVVLDGGIKVISGNDGENEDRNLSLEFNGQNIEIDGDLKLEVKDEIILLQGKEISVSVEDAKEKAKKAASADMILDFKFSKDDDEVSYSVRTEKNTKFLGLFDFAMESEVKINVETGVVVEVDEPWYSFLLF